MENKRYLIALDCDGTLLNDKKEIDSQTLAYLKELQSRGHLIVLASGRPSRAIMPYYEQLGLRSPYVAYNGALIHNPFQKKEKALSHLIKKEVIKDFLSRFEENSFKNLMSENEKDIYYLHDDKTYDLFFHPEGVNKKVGSFNALIQDDEFNFLIESQDLSRNQEIEQYVLNRYEDLAIRFWYDVPQFGEFYYKSINKGTALLDICREYKIPLANTIAFGDSPNDLEMLETVQTSFAMANGAAPLKKAASFITSYDNNSAGVYKALKDILH